MQQQSYSFCVSCVCLSPLLCERDRSEAPNPNSAKTHTPTRRRRTPSSLPDKTYSTPNKQNPNSHLLSLTTTKTTTKLHNSATKSSLFCLSRFSPPLSRSPRALSLSLSLSPSLPPCGKLQTLIALGLVCPSLGQCRTVIRKRKGWEGREK
jgi:hypothetical protein